MTTGDGKTTPITGEDEVEATVNTMEALLDRIGERDPDDPDRMTFTFDENGQVVWLHVPETLR